MKQFLLYIMLISFGLPVCAQIKGTVVDESKNPIPYANVVLLANDSSFIEGTITDSVGSYKLDKIFTIGDMVKCSYVGYKPSFIHAPNSICNFILQEDKTMLKEVVVKSKFPQYHLISGGFSANVQNTFLADMGTANDVLSSIPRVHGGNGVFNIFGKGTATIYINGRKVNDNSELSRLNSKDIKSISVLTTPGVKYSSETNAVIIIKVKRRDEGLGINLDNNLIVAHKLSGRQTLDVSYRKNKLDLFAQMGCSVSRNHMSQTVEQNIKGAVNNISEKYEDYVSNYRNAGFIGKLGGDYEVNDSNSLGFTYNFSRSLGNPSTFSNYKDNLLINNALSQTIDYDMQSYSKRGPSHELNVYYSGKIGNFSIAWDATYLQNKSRTNSINKELQTGANRFITTYSNSMDKMFANKLDLDYDFNDALSLNFGYDYYLSKVNKKYSNLEGIITPSDDKIKESNMALYVSLDYSFGNFGLNGGVRYEHVKRSNEEALSNYNIGKVYNHFFPTFSISYDASPLQLSLSYSTSVSRPSYSQLSNMVTYNSKYLYESGDPMLQSSYERSFDFQAVYKFVNLSLSYEYDKDPIVNWARLYNSVSDIVLLTSENITKKQYVVGSLTMTPIIGIWHPSVELDFQKQFIPHDNLPYNFGKPAWIIKVDNKFVCKHHWIFGISYLYHNTFNDGYLKSYESNVVNSFVSKEFFQKALLVKLQVNDIFNGGHSRTNMYTPIYNLYQERYEDNRKVSLSISLRLSHLKARYKGNGAGKEERTRM